MSTRIGTLTGFALAVELGDWHCFTGKTIGSFVGLVPSEYSSGTSRVRGWLGAGASCFVVLVGALRVSLATRGSG